MHHQFLSFKSRILLAWALGQLEASSRKLPHPDVLPLSTPNYKSIVLCIEETLHSI